MALYSRVVSTTGAGGVADTFDNVGTVTLRDDATMVLGVWVVAAPVVAAAQEAIQGQIRITMQGVGSELYPAPPYSGGHPATNVSVQAVAPKFIPFVHNVQGATDVIIDYTTHVQDPTNANAVVAAVVYIGGAKAPGKGPADVMAHFPLMAPWPAEGTRRPSGRSSRSPSRPSRTSSSPTRRRRSSASSRRSRRIS